MKKENRTAGAQPRLKSSGGPRFGSQHRAKGRAKCWVREGDAPSQCEGPVVGKFF